MDTEAVVNGNSADADCVEEKILKPRKSAMLQEETAIHLNGNNENGCDDKLENGHDEETLEEENTKEVSVTSKKNDINITESTPQKRELRPREGTPRPLVEQNQKTELTKREKSKESTPKPEKSIRDTPKKRELRARMSTPKPEETTTSTHTIEEPTNTIPKSDEANTSTQKSEEKETSLKEDPVEIDLKSDGTHLDKKNPEITSGNADEEYKTHNQGFFSSLLSTKRASPKTDSKKISEPKCNESSITESYDINSDIKSRRAINAFSRFPGRNVSLSPSNKRKAEDDSFDHQNKKRFTGHTEESGSEKSPGWRFLSSPFGRWSPRSKFVPTSTPFKKYNDGDSMAVNFNENSKLGFESTTQITVENGSTAPRDSFFSKCSVM